MVKIENAALQCPGCGFGNLHQHQIEIFERPEDEESGNHVVISGDDVTINRDITSNPSPRRNGLVIKFECEICDKSPVLFIYQHKGSTFMEWQKEKRKSMIHPDKYPDETVEDIINRLREKMRREA